ncbi:hypothetical protein C9374_007470 [Naegleria lovaniensis]|uniref:B30.2/SPRY domain-containing protein n=1 Tax=Naegleria lovaniensis TaxID=51637 RepID=A0AA88KIM1_NAELO|nr:uncharacterized protein C9374_007470 [Naegleria lovaniensis]KAG2379331.1 hypothetical protein C9374_007470 [Naegleria lovaniensis]
MNLLHTPPLQRRNKVVIDEDDEQHLPSSASEEEYEESEEEEMTDFQHVHAPTKPKRPTNSRSKGTTHSDESDSDRDDDDDDSSSSSSSSDDDDSDWSVEERDGEDVVIRKYKHIGEDQNPTTPVTFQEKKQDFPIKIKDDKCSIGVSGYCMIHATHCLESGAYYYEVKIENNMENNSVPDYARKPHYRVGWCLKGAFDKGPCGFDKLSYGYGSKDGKVYYKSKGIPYGEPFGEAGDVIGCYIEIPKVETPPIKYIESAFFGDDGQQYKQFTATLDEKPVIGSKIVFFKNGKYQGIAFSDIMFGAYFPAISLYMNACVTVRFEAHQFQYNPHDCNPEVVNKNWKAIGELRKRTKIPQKPPSTPSKEVTGTGGEFKAPKPRHREAIKSTTGSMVEAARKLHSSPSNPRHSKIASASTQSTPLHNEVSKKHKKNKKESSSVHPKQPKQAVTTNHQGEAKKSSSSKHNKRAETKDVTNTTAMPPTTLSASHTQMNNRPEAVSSMQSSTPTRANIDPISSKNDIALNSARVDNSAAITIPQNTEKKKTKKSHQSSSEPSKMEKSHTTEHNPQDKSAILKEPENVPSTTLEERSMTQQDDSVMTDNGINNSMNQVPTTVTLQEEFAQLGIAISNMKEPPIVDSKPVEHHKKGTPKPEAETSPRNSSFLPQTPPASAANTSLSVTAASSMTPNEQHHVIPSSTPASSSSASTPSTMPAATITTSSHPPVVPLVSAATSSTYITNMSDKPLAQSTATPTKERKSKTAKAESSLMMMARKTQVDHNPKKGIGLLKNKKDETVQNKTPLKRKNSLSKEEEHVAVHHHTTKLVDPPKPTPKKKPEDSSKPSLSVTAASSSGDVNTKTLEDGSNITLEAPEQHLTVSGTVDDFSPSNKKRKTSKEIPYEPPFENQPVRASEMASIQRTNTDTSSSFASKTSHQQAQQQSHHMTPQLQQLEPQLSERILDMDQATTPNVRQQAPHSQQQQQTIRQESQHVEQFMPNMLLKQNQTTTTFDTNLQSQESIRSRSNSFQSLLLNVHPQQSYSQQVNQPTSMSNYQITGTLSQQQKFASMQETSMLNAFHNLSEQQPVTNTNVSSSRTEQYTAPVSFRELLLSPPTATPSYSQPLQSSLSTNIHANQIESSTMQSNLMNNPAQFNQLLTAQSHHQQTQHSQQRSSQFLSGHDQTEQFSERSLGNADTFVDSFSKYMAPRKLSDPPQPATPLSAQSQQMKQTFNPTQFIQQRNVSNASMQHNPSSVVTSGNYQMVSQQQQIHQPTSNTYSQQQFIQTPQSNLPQQRNTNVASNMHQPYPQQQQQLHQTQMRAQQYNNFGASIMAERQLPSMSDSFTNASANRSSLLASMSQQQPSSQQFMKQQASQLSQHQQQFHQQINMSSPTTLQHVQNYPSQHQQHYSSGMSHQQMSSNNSSSFLKNQATNSQQQLFSQQQPPSQPQHSQYLSNANNYRGAFQ